jgi:hypothetical protein
LRKNLRKSLTINELPLRGIARPRNSFSINELRGFFVIPCSPSL